jgi:hypothetical protein
MKLVRSFLPAALGRHGPLPVAAAIGGLVLLMAGIGGAFALSTGSSGDRPDRDGNEIGANTSTPPPVSGMPTPSAGAPRLEGPSASVGGDSAPAGDAQPVNGIMAGKWIFPWQIIENPCNLQLATETAYTFQEVQDTDGIISHGEKVHIYGHNADGTTTDIGELPFPFTYPTFDFTWNYSQDLIVRNITAFGGPDSPYAWQGERHRIWRDGSSTECQVQQVSPNHPDYR